MKDRSNSMENAMKLLQSRDKFVSTVNLNAKENDRREGDAESRNYSKTLRKRVRSQESEIAKITRTIHNGGKADFCLAFSLSVSSNKNKRPANEDDGNWDGRLSVDDLIEILKIIQVSKQTNLYESLVKCHSAKQFHINAEEILKMCDTKNTEDVIKYLRKRLPGFLAPERETKRLKSSMNRCMNVLDPKMTATGMSINPMKLHQCLLYLYHWLEQEEWWRLFGDASKLGREQTTLIGLTLINNCQALQGVKWHSPKEVWTTNLFFLKDSRANVEANLGRAGGELGDFLGAMKQLSNHVYLSADSMFCDAIFGGKLGPTTNSGWNMFMNMSKSEKGNFDQVTGRRSTMMLSLNRSNEEKLLPIDEDHVGVDPNHAVSRIVEKLIKLVVSSIDDIASNLPARAGKQMRAESLRNLIANIADRDVHRGKEGVFTLRFDDNDKLKDFTLNTTTAEVILAPPCEFGPRYRLPRHP